MLYPSGRYREKPLIPAGDRFLLLGMLVFVPSESGTSLEAGILCGLNQRSRGILIEIPFYCFLYFGDMNQPVCIALAHVSVKYKSFRH